MADVSMLRAEQTHIIEALDALHEWYQAAVDEADQPLPETEPCPPTLRDGETRELLPTRRRPSWCLDLRPDGQCDGCPSYPCENIPGHER